MKLINLDLEKINLIENTRAENSNMVELMSSIKDNGLIQPVVVAKDWERPDEYVLVCGNRRLAAHKKLGMKKIKAVINNDINNMTDLMLTNMSENIQRENVSPYEEGRFVSELLTDYDLSISEIAVRLGVARNRVDSAYNVFKQTPIEFIDKIAFDTTKQENKGKMSITVAKRLNLISEQVGLSLTQKRMFYKTAYKKELSGRKLSFIARKLKKNKTKSVRALIKETDDITSVRCDIHAYTKDVDRLCKKYNMNKMTLIQGMMTGKIKERLRDPLEF